MGQQALQRVLARRQHRCLSWIAGPLPKTAGEVAIFACALAQGERDFTDLGSGT